MLKSRRELSQAMAPLRRCRLQVLIALLRRLWRRTLSISFAYLQRCLWSFELAGQRMRPAQAVEQPSVRLQVAPAQLSSALGGSPCAYLDGVP